MERQVQTQLVQWAVIVTLVLTTTLVGNAKCDDAGNFQVGVGIADITGPSVGIGMVKKEQFQFYFVFVSRSVLIDFSSLICS